MTSLRHLAMLTRVLPHHTIGGMQAVAWDLATEIARRGVTVTVLTAEIPGYPEQFEDRGVQVRALNGVSWRRYGWRWWRTSRRVFEHELLSRCDLVLSISAAGFGLLKLRPRAPSVPFVLQAHGTSAGEMISKWRSGSVAAIASSLRNAAWIARDLAAYRRFDAIVAVGTGVATDLSKPPITQFTANGRLSLIRNGIDTALFKPDSRGRLRQRAELTWSEDQKVVISVSRLHRQKGLDLGLDAIALLLRKNPNARYIIVGDGPECATLKLKAVQLGISDHVEFVGTMSRSTIASYLNAADAFMFTSRRIEGNPLNILEALAVGLPVVASHQLRRCLPPSDQIFFAEHTDAAAVAAALDDALEVEPCRTSMLPPGCSMTESVEAYLALFDDLIACRT